MVFLGSRGKFDQITLVRLDPQAPTEDSTGQVEQNIFTGDLEASNVFTSNVGISNLYPTHNFDLGSNLWMNDQGLVTLSVKKRALFEQARVSTQFAVNADTPSFPFQVNDTNRVFVDNFGTDLFNVEGNVACQNIRVTQGVDITGDLVMTGNVTATKIIVEEAFDFGANISFNDVGDPVFAVTGNVDVNNGDLEVNGDVRVNGNVYIRDYSTYKQQVNLELSNAILLVGSGNDDGDYDTSIVFHQQPSNIFVGYFPSADEVRIGRTDTGPGADNVNILENSKVDLHVYGNVVTSENIGAANLNPVHHLDVGANLWVHDTASNVLFVSGNAYFERATFGHGFNLGSNVVVDDTAANVFQVGGRAAFTTLFATERVGIANTNPVHTLCIGANIHMHETGANLAMFHGNVVSERFFAEQRVGILEYDPEEALHINGNVRMGSRSTVDLNAERYIKSTGSIVVHADDFGTDNSNNRLALRAGAIAANVSAIDLTSGATDAATQHIKLKTRNTERVVVNADGFVGIANVSPSATLTVGGAAQIVGSNTFDVGEVWGSNKTTLRSVVSPALGQTYLQSRVPSGKGFNVTVSSGPTQGTPKMTILESGKVGIGTTEPQTVGLQVTGNVFVHDQVEARNGYVHETAPMTVTHPSFADNPDSMQPVIQLCRDATTNSIATFGARAVLALGKHDQIEAGKSNTRLDFGLAHTEYNTANVVMTLLSTGLVGIGTHTPESKLEVRATGSAFASPRTNGILVYNANDADNEDAVVCMEVNDQGGDALTSYKITSGDTVGWSSGGSFSDNSKYKIANHAGDLNTNTRLVIDNNGDVGINVNEPQYKLDVDGQVRIGNKLLFRGVAADTSDTSFLEERALNDEITELLLFKTNDSAAGADQIRHVAARHVFKVYNKPVDLDETVGLTTDQINQIVTNDGTDIAGVYDATPVLSIEKERRVLINSVEENIGTNTRLYVDGNVQLKQGSYFDTENLQILTENTGLNVIRAREQSDLAFRFGEIASFERVRFTSAGGVGIGTNAPNKLLHLYDDTVSDITLLNLESPAGASASKYTGLQLTTDRGYGAFLKAQKGATSNSVVLGYVDNDVHVPGIYVGEDGHVGVGTSAPRANIHVYDSNILVEHTTSNAMVEFKTNGATSNIYMNALNDDMYIHPAGGNVVIQGSLTVQQDIDFGGRIEFGDAVGIQIAQPQAPLHVNGGTITNSDQVAKKTYSATFTARDTVDKNIKLTFGNGAFYAKITAMLRYVPDGKYINTMILEVQGGHSNNTQTSTIPIAVGTKNIFGGSNPYPWNRVLRDMTATTVGLQPAVSRPLSGADADAYYYDIFVELTTSCGGKLVNIKRDTETKAEFTY